MTYYSVLAVTPTNEDWIPDYIEPVTALVAKHGGKYLARTASHEQIEGAESAAALRAILEWPSKHAALAFITIPNTHRISRPGPPARTVSTSSSKARTTSPERTIPTRRPRWRRTDKRRQHYCRVCWTNANRVEESPE